MPEQAPDLSKHAMDYRAMDYNAVYRGEENADGVTFGRAPWDIGEPQPGIVQLEEAGKIRGTVLDVGCGPGRNAVFLASRGHSVVGVDGSDAAIDQAREHARDKGVDIRFLVSDATSLAELDQRYDTVLDSALYHCLPEESRTAYAAALHRVTKPGARLHLFCFADQGPSFAGPAAVSQENLRTHIGSQWSIESIESTRYVGHFDEAVLQQFSRMDPDFKPAALERDEQGRALFPFWYLTATRA
jgi:SAM-dependent methyltransferase